MLIAIGDLLIRFGDVFSGFIFAWLSLATGSDSLNISQWLLFFFALAILAPRLYPTLLNDLTASLPFRLTIATSGTGIAIVLDQINDLDDVATFGLIAIGFLGAVSVILRLEDVSFFKEDSPLVSALDWFAPREGVARDELKRAKRYDGWRRTISLGIFALSTHVVFFVPVLIAGIIVALLAQTFPIPDLLVITYGFGLLVAWKVETISKPPATLDVDNYLLRYTRQATSGTHGIFLTLLFGVGLFATVMTPFAVLQQTVSLLPTTFRAPIQPLFAWNVVGIHVLYLTGTLYGLWFWLGMAPRITAFLERWNGEQQKTRLVARPKSLLLPSLVVTSVASAGLSNGFLAENRHLFAVAWPIAILGLGWVVWHTRRRHPTVGHREDVAVVGAVIVAIWILMGNIAILSNDPMVLVSPKTGMLCGIVLYVAGIGYVCRYGDSHNSRYGSETDDERRFAFPVYLGVGGLITLLSAGYFIGAVQVLLLIGGVALFGFGVVLGVVKYYRL